MEKGFYWVQAVRDAPEVWYFVDGEGGGWYQPSQSLPLQPPGFRTEGIPGYQREARTAAFLIRLASLPPYLKLNTFQ